MRKIFVVCAVLLVVAPSAFADSIARNGVWWGTLTKTQKVIFIAGFFDGQTYAEKIFDGADLIYQADPKTGRWDPQRARILVGSEKLALKMLDHDFGNIPAERLAAGLDQIYADYRNTRILISDALTAVVRSIDGESSDAIDQLLEAKRKEISK